RQPCALAGGAGGSVQNIAHASAEGGLSSQNIAHGAGTATASAAGTTASSGTRTAVARTVDFENIRHPQQGQRAAASFAPDARNEQEESERPRPLRPGSGREPGPAQA